MNKITILFIVPLVSFLIGVASTILYFNVRDKQVLKIQNPNSSWEPIFFHAIDEHARSADLPDILVWSGPDHGCEASSIQHDVTADIS